MRKFMLAAAIAVASFLCTAEKASAHGWWGPRFVYVYRPWYSITYPWSGYIPGYSPFFTPSVFMPPGYFLYPGYFYVPFGTIYAPFYGQTSTEMVSPASEAPVLVRRGPRVPVTEGPTGPQVAGPRTPANTYRFTSAEK
jgi:hypothetical protein